MAAPESGYAVDAKHYQSEGQQPIEDMQQDLSVEGMLGFLQGNVLKYVRRCGKKGSPVTDMQKVIQYATWWIEVSEGRKINPRDIVQNPVGREDEKCEPESVPKTGEMTARELYRRENKGKEPEAGMCPAYRLSPGKAIEAIGYCFLYIKDKEYTQEEKDLFCKNCWEQKVRVNV